MKLSLALFALLCSSGEAFVPVSVPRPSLVSIQATQNDHNENLISKRLLATTAATMLSFGIMLGGDVMPAMAATKSAPVVEQVSQAKKQAAPVIQPKKQAAPVEQVAAKSKKQSAPVAPEKKAVDSAKAALDAANSKISMATKEGSAAKAANEKAIGLVKKCEAAAVQAKGQFLNENDKLVKLKGNKNTNSDVIVKEQQKVGTYH
jgi:uncharacterized protein YegP (UPF0339 family)